MSSYRLVGAALFLYSLRQMACQGFTERPDWQAHCLQSAHCMPTTTCRRYVKEGAARDGSWPICADHLQSGNCLVYSFGIATDWSFDKEMGSFGCEVHSFDPTVELPEALAPNVTFHQWGLAGKDTSKITQGASDLYGQQKGQLLTLHEIRTRLGHHGHIDALKIDCEGCEWGFFAGLAKAPGLLPDQLAIEFHFTPNFGINDPESFLDIADAFQVLSLGGYERIFWHDNPGTPGTFELYHELLGAGFPPDSCCKEMVFKRQRDPLRAHTLKSLRDHTRGLPS